MGNKFVALGGKLTRRRAMLAGLGFVVALTTVMTLVLTAGAFSWSPKAHVGDNGGAPMFQITMRTRPTDGVVFAVGNSGSGGGGIGPQSLEVVRMDQPNTLLCDGNCDDTPAQKANNKAPRLTFAPNGTGFLAYRHLPDPKYRGYMRVINPNGSFQRGVDIGLTFLNSGGGDYLDFPDVAYSAAAQKLYMVGKVGYGSNQPAVFASSSDNGQSWNSFQTIVDNYDISGGSSPLDTKVHLCVDGSDNVHTISYGTGDVYVRSRVNGAWGAPIKMANAPEYGTYGYRGPDAITCGPDGYAYAVWASSGSFGEARYTPGQGWAKISGNVRPGEPTYEMDLYATANGTVVMAAGYFVNGNPPSSGKGMAVLTSTDRGQNFTGPETAIPFPDGWGTTGVAVTGTPAYGGRLYVGAQFNDPRASTRDSSYATAPFVIGPPTPASFSVNAPFTNAEPSRTLQPLTITVRDVSGNPIPNSGNVVLAKTTGPGTLGGTLTQAVNAAGTVTFSDLSLDSIGTYTLTATIGGKSVVIGPFAVKGQLVFTTQPTSAAVNGGQTVVVSVIRPSDNSVITNYGGVNVQLSIPAGNGPAGATFSPTTAPINNGVATFSGLTFSQISPAYRLLAVVSNTDPVLPNYSNTFEIGANLTVSRPGNNNSGNVQGYGPFDITVTVNDASNTLVGYNGLVEIKTTTSTAGGLVYGPRTAYAVNGVATFTNMAVSDSANFTFSATLPLSALSAPAVNVTSDGTNCGALLVNNSVDNASDNPNGCDVSLRGALSRATTVGSIVRIKPSLSNGQTIPLGGSLTVPAGITIDAGYGSTVTITSDNQIILSGNDTLRGMALKGHFVLNGGGNVLSSSRESVR